MTDTSEEKRSPLSKVPRNAEELDQLGRQLYGAKWSKHMAARERAKRMAAERGLADHSVGLDAFLKKIEGSDQ